MAFGEWPFFLIKDFWTVKSLWNLNPVNARGADPRNQPLSWCSIVWWVRIETCDMHATDRQKRQAWCSPGGADSQLGSIGHWSIMLSCVALCSRMRQSTRRRREDGMAGLPWNREMISFGNIVLAMESRESVAALEQLAVFVLCILFNLLQAHWINSLDRSIQPLSMFFNLWLAGFGRHSSDPYSTVLAERGGENSTFWRWCYLGLLDLWRMRSSCFAMSLFHFTSFVSGNGLTKSEFKSWVFSPFFTFPVQISQRGIVLDRAGLHKLWVHRCKAGFHAWSAGRRSFLPWFDW